MIFTPGQEALVLDTTHRPTGTAIVERYQTESRQYIVLFKYPGGISQRW